MEKKTDYEYLRGMLCGMNYEEILCAISGANTGEDDYQNFLPVSVYENLEPALHDFIQALKEHNSKNLLDSAFNGNDSDQ